MRGSSARCANGRELLHQQMRCCWSSRTAARELYQVLSVTFGFTQKLFRCHIPYWVPCFHIHTISLLTLHLHECSSTRFAEISFCFAILVGCEFCCLCVYALVQLHEFVRILTISLHFCRMCSKQDSSSKTQKDAPAPVVVVDNSWDYDTRLYMWHICQRLARRE